jgi:phage shock protein A
MSSTRRTGLLGRIFGLLRGTLSLWVRDGERANPRAVYEQAIDARTRQYHELKDAVAGILYMRNKLEAEIAERRAEIARLHDDVRRAVGLGRDEVSVALIARKHRLLGDLERAERELDELRGEAEEAKANLLRFRHELRSLVHEKGRMLATLANAQARRRMHEALEGLSVDAEMKALEGVREHVARLATEGGLERELGDEPLRARLRRIRDDADDEAARRELAELKRELRAGAAPAGALAPEARGLAPA